MRFIENGPSIPDELLVARDQGRVVFFCGAGVSLAKAGLPDFFGLADKVLRKLGVSKESPVLKIVDEARDIEERTGVAGLISADRIFGLLEREFFVHDIEAAVASVLKPVTTPPDLTAHEILLDLATTQEGIVRLVTTNFDNLFDECGRPLETWKPPRLPDPSRPTDMNGIVYLHGKVNSDYSGSEGDGFVLSSAQFGRAYLSEGWATAFIRDIIDRYVVVFVGYTADDPPVHYLLEALNKTYGTFHNVYAFQAGTVEEATTRWKPKGVEAIPYDEANGHISLWQTLEKWAARATNPEQWHSEIIEKAKKGPENLLPYERGQVTHIVSTIDGMRKFCECKEPLPAEWLCVFDSFRRYARPGYLGTLGNQGPYIDPFDLYCIDSEITPTKIGLDDFLPKREVPDNSWSAFDLNSFDRINLIDANYASLRGHGVSEVPQLPHRLRLLANWIVSIASQSATIWWAVRQYSLHPEIQTRIQWDIERSQEKYTEDTRKAWRYLFEYWKKGDRDKLNYASGRYGLEVVIKKEGWCNWTVRQYALYSKPYIKVEKCSGLSPKPPCQTDEIELRSLLSLEVEYPTSIYSIDIPNDWILPVVIELRKNLELSIDLEKEIGGYGLSNIGSIAPVDDRSEDEDEAEYERNNGISGAIIRFAILFERLIQEDKIKAQQEFSRWLTDDITIFALLKIWAASKPELVPSKQFKTIISNLDDDAFWDMNHQRDLMLTLSSRWKSLSAGTRIQIEKRILAGPPCWEQENNENYKERHSQVILNRITWLAGNGCDLSLDLESETRRLQVFAPNWCQGQESNITRTSWVRCGFVKTNDECSSLLTVPISSILMKARELKGRQEDFLTEHDPFAGLSVSYPKKAFGALILSAKVNDFPESEWQTFLNLKARENDTPEFTAAIAEQLSSFSENAIRILLRQVTDWLSGKSSVLATQYPKIFESLISIFIRALSIESPNSTSAIVRKGQDPDWVMESINSPTGKIAEALFDDPRREQYDADKGIPHSWLKHIETLLDLPGDLRRHSLATFTYNLNWFYWHSPKWSEYKLLSVLSAGDKNDKDAFWGGFFRSGRTPSQKLYLHLKSNLIELSKERTTTRRGHTETLTAIVLSGWILTIEGTDERYISDTELRDILIHADEEFHSRLLSHIKRSINKTKSESNIDWTILLPELLSKVWPRQKFVKTSKISSRFCDIAFSNEVLLPKLTELILPFLTKIDRNCSVISTSIHSNTNSIIKHPYSSLILLYAIMPDDVSAWPYGIENSLSKIVEADKGLKSNEKYIELKRKWDSR